MFKAPRYTLDTPMAAAMYADMRNHAYLISKLDRQLCTTLRIFLPHARGRGSPNVLGISREGGGGGSGSVDGGERGRKLRERCSIAAACLLEV